MIKFIIISGWLSLLFMILTTFVAWLCGRFEKDSSSYNFIEDEPEEYYGDEDRLILNEIDHKIFVDAITNPPEPGEGLKKAKLNYDKFIQENDL